MGLGVLAACDAIYSGSGAGMSPTMPMAAPTVPTKCAEGTYMRAGNMLSESAGRMRIQTRRAGERN